MVVSPSPLAWIIAIVLLALFWPLAQRLRHKDLKPPAAYLLFTSAFVLVGSAAFMLIVQIGRVLLPEEAILAPIAFWVVLPVAVLLASVAAYLVVRRPQVRRMPR